jgi:RimJ/RimL family protein N-acetyltransferase
VGCRVGDLSGTVDEVGLLSLVPLTETGDLATIQSWFQDAELRRRLAFPSREWLAFVSADPDEVAQVACEDGVPVGFVQVEREPDGTATLAFCVRPDLRGRGYGKRILRAALDSPHLADVGTIRGGVEPDNEASLRCLRAFGFGEEPYPDRSR